MLLAEMTVQGWLYARLDIRLDPIELPIITV